MMRKFKRVDLTGATEDYFLKVGEEAYISFSDVTEVPLHIATQDGTYYEMHIITSNTGGTSGGIASRVYLYPNNTVYDGAFYYAEVLRKSDNLYHNYLTYSSFRIGYTFTSTTVWITNRTQYKNVRGIYDIYGISGHYPSITMFSTDWRDTATPWVSLGTVVFPQSTSGEILVRRLR